MSIDIYVGQNIKKYRQAHKLTLEELARSIHKSKSTMSKYEKGNISLDIATMTDIAHVLHVSPAQLMAAPAEQLPIGGGTGEFLDKQYMYSYDGRSRRILRSVMERYRIPENDEVEINLFYDVEDIKNWGECKTLYSGHSKKYEFVENYSLQNQNNTTEQALICCINSLGRTNRKIGLLTGLSYKTMLPVAIKVMISSAALKEDEELITALRLTKEDIKVSRKYNLFTIDQFM